MNSEKCKVGIVFGGRGCLCQSSLISARYLYELLLEMPDYSPELLFFDVGNNKAFYQLPVHLLYKEDIGDIWDGIRQWEQTDTPNITGSDIPIRVAHDQLSNLVDVVWLTLQERPGTDGQLQMTLERLGIPYNTSDVAVMNLLQNKEGLYDFLKENDFSVQSLFRVEKQAYEGEIVPLLKGIEAAVPYPLYAEEVEAHCLFSSTAINDRKDLLAWLDIVFRDSYAISDKEKEKWGMEKKPNVSSFFLRTADHSREGTGAHPFVAGVYTTQAEDGLIAYELSKVMEAGEGGLTPLEVKKEGQEDADVLSQVRIELERLVRILDMKGLGLIEGVVQIRESGVAEVVVSRIQGVPLLGAEAAFVGLEWQNGETMDVVVDKIVTFGIQRAAIKKTAMKKTRMEEGIKNEEQLKEVSVATSEAESSVEEVLSAKPIGDLKDEKEPILIFLKRFVRSKTLWKNVGAILGFLLVGFIALKVWMSSYTHHGDFIVVDNFVGLDLEDGIARSASQDLEMVVLEKHFEAGATPNEIYQQTPKADAHIKPGRKIYVNVYTDSQLEFELPSIIGNDNFELYTRGLRKHPFQLNTVIKEKQFNAKLEDNTILYMYYEGKKITPNDLKKGVKVLQGSTLEFVVSTRYSNYANVPDVVCQNFDAVEFVLSSSDLQLGAIVGGESGFVIKQEPPAGKRLLKGSKVKIFTAAARPERCKN